MAKPFTIAVPDERLAIISAKVAAFDWGALPDAGGWQSGVGLADLKRLVDYWRTRFDWRAQERRLNALPQFTMEVLGQQLHFVHARGDGSRPPLLLLHGWPGSFIEFEALIAPLVADGHDIVVPSLPGYAFSGRPAAPIGPRQTAELMHGLMVELFGDARYLVQGGDWGAAIGGWMAHDHPKAVAALHLNMVLMQAADAMPKTPRELAWAAQRAKLAKEETGYSQEQGTRPQTLGVAMADSPVGVAAWILEKFGAWADVPRDAQGRPDLWQAFDEDLLLTNIMLYLVEGSFVTSTWMYRGRVLEGSGEFPTGARIKVPTGVAAFPDPVFPSLPRSQARKTYNIVHWTDMEAGGHFAALEQPELLLSDMRRFFADQASSKDRRRRRAVGIAGLATVGLAAAAFYTRAANARVLSSSSSRDFIMTYLPYSPTTEHANADEQETIDGIIKGMTGQSETVEKREQHAVRASHAKSSACVVGELIVPEGLPPELAQGLFAKPATYKIAARFAQGPGETLGDRVSTHRGMSIKVFGVEGDKLPGHDVDTQDFVLATGTTFPSGTAKGFLRDGTVIGGSAGMPEVVKSAVSSTMRNFNRVLHAFGTESAKADFFGHPFSHPMAEGYFSQAPVRFGNYVAKLGVVPVAAEQLALADWRLDPREDEDGFRHAAIAYFGAHDAAYELKAQLQADAELQPIEDASVDWPVEISPYRTVATIRLPRQDAYEPKRVHYFDEVMTFRPAHSLAAHRPLGSVMRARLRVYKALSDFRHSENGIVAANTALFEDIPA